VEQRDTFWVRRSESSGNERNFLLGRNKLHFGVKGMHELSIDPRRENEATKKEDGVNKKKEKRWSGKKNKKTGSLEGECDT